MCLIYFILMLFAGVSALALWLLPLWLAITLILLVGIPLVWGMWKISRFVKKLKQQFGELIPQERLCTLASNEPFRGHGFSFTFPVRCEVSHTHFQEVEALILKPAFEFPGAPKDSLMVASTFSKAELKPKIDGIINKIFAQIQTSSTEKSAPVQVGAFTGERRTLSVTKDGKTINAEAVYLDGQTGSIIWLAIAPAETFATLSEKYRELACLIQRIEIPEQRAAL